MKPYTFLFILMAVLLIGAGCESDAQSGCFQAGNLQACGEACDLENDMKACVKRDEIGLQQCMTDGNLETCAYMCQFSGSGKDVYCNHIKAKCQAKDQTACSIIEERGLF